MGLGPLRLSMKLIVMTLLLSISGTAIFAQELALHTSPAQDRIAFTNQQIAKNPGKSNLYTELAIALLRRERETSDKSLFAEAQAALDKAFKLSPENMEAQKTEAALLLERHEFAKALSLATALNKNVPDDVMTYGYIADADIALGDYPAAEKAAQWMLDLRAHNVPGLLRGAELRQIYGDSEGALQFLSDAYQQTSPEQSEEIAWLLTRMAEINLATGKLDEADTLLRRALASFPDYYRSLEVQAQLRDAQHKYAEAADLSHRRNLNFPQPESIYAEAKPQDKAGNREKANELYANFERLAQSESNSADNDNRDLILYYVAHKQDAPAALRIAKLLIAQRHDVWTLDSYSMALYTSRDFSEAQKQIEKALEPGIRNADIFYHAAEISAALKNQAATVRYLKSSIEANPESLDSDSARTMLEKLGAPEYGARSK